MEDLKKQLQNDTKKKQVGTYNEKAFLPAGKNDTHKKVYTSKELKHLKNVYLT